jgi:hypothetical protein
LSIPAIRNNLIVMTSCWLVCAFNLYMISFYVKYIPGSFYMNSMAKGIAEIVGFTAAGIVVERIGVKKSLSLAFGLSFIGGIGILIYDLMGLDDGWLLPAMILFCLTGVSGGFQVVYSANAQLFPVLFSATALGICNFLARLSTIFAPMVAETKGNTPMVIFTVLCAATTVSPNFLKVKPAAKD